MKRLYIILLITISIFTTKVFAQDYGNKVDPLKLCIAIQGNNFISDAEAENALDRILSVIGASKRFVLQPCDNIDNAVAVSYKGIRYILYDKEFMNSVSSGNNWSNLFILAHEVGHHINGHSLDLVLYATETVEAGTLLSRRQQELEADEFAGFILGKLGASLQQTNLAVNLLATDSDDTYSSHPSRSKRLAAISLGHNNSLDKSKIYSQKQVEGDKLNNILINGLRKLYQLRDYSGAISDLSKAIEIAPERSMFLARGRAKAHLKDYYGAIADFTLAIEFNQNPDYKGLMICHAYIERGKSKSKLNDHIGAIKDFNKAIEIHPKNSDAYFRRANSKADLENYHGAIEDYSKAIEIDSSDYYFYYNRGYSKAMVKDFYGAIADFTSAIFIKPNEADGYYSRATSKYSLGDFSGACFDGKKAKELGDQEADALILDSCN
jgi:tetratricopeptide (TPR) repeat protein